MSGLAAVVGPGFKRGLLTVIESAGKKDRHGRRRWRVRCQCGKEIEAFGYELGRVKGGGASTCGKKECVRIFKAQSMMSSGGAERGKFYDSAAQRIQAHINQNGGKVK